MSHNLEAIQAASHRVVEALGITNEVRPDQSVIVMTALVDVVASLVTTFRDPESARNMFVRQLDATIDLLQELPELLP